MLDRFFRKPPVDDQNPRAAFVRFADEVEPEFGFHQNDDARFNMPQSAAHGEFPIERKIKNEFRVFRKDFFSERLSGQGRRGDNQTIFRKSFLKGFNQRTRRIRFADRNAVQPPNGSLILFKSGQFSESLPQARRVFSLKQKSRQKREKSDG